MIPKYEGTLIRPPSEAESLIFQITLGCTDNNCTFCPAYKDKPFKIKPLKTIIDEINESSKLFPETRKVFLADGDAIIYPQNDLINILKALQNAFPKLTRVSVYASAKSLQTKTVDNLLLLKENKLTLVYLGIESGDLETYKNTLKFGSPMFNVEQCLKIKKAEIKLNTTIILGLGGKYLSEQHALNTAKILNLIEPQQIAALTLMIVKGTKMYDQMHSKAFSIPDEMTLLKELFLIIKNLKDWNCLFFSNHASNYFPINARFPKDKDLVLSAIYNIITTNNKSLLRPEIVRGL